MSRLDELIQKFCPNGVEFVKIKEVFPRLKGTPITAGKMKEIENSAGEIKIFAGGKTVISAKEIDIPKANIIRVPAVLVQSRGVIDVIYYDKPFTFKNEMWAYTADNPSKVKYLYYILKNNIQAFRAAASGMGSLPQISLSVTEDLHIPLPPLPIQQEIVHILDTFTNFTAELTDKLNAELTARRKQYEYYRDELLTFGEDIERRTIGDVCLKIASGGTPATGKMEYYGGDIPWLRTQEVDWNDIWDTGVKISKAGLENSSAKWIPENCVVVAMYGATAAKVAVNRIPLTTNQACCNLLINEKIVMHRYVFYWLSKEYSHLKEMGQGSQSNINAKIIRNYLIPIPPMERQQYIVSILDRFRELCAAFSGISEEILLRQKQYEYYRDKLLNFREK